MKTYTIENETNNITIHATAKEADALADAQRFRNEAGLAKLAADWPMARLIEIWNSLSGVSPVKKFKDRTTAVGRIWNVVQKLDTGTGEAHPEAATTDADTTPHAPAVARKQARASKKTTRTKHATTESADAKAPREGSKTSHVIAMLQRGGGTTIEEIMTSMQWQKHTIRALLSAGGSLTRKHGLVITSEKVGDERRYFIKA